MNQDTLIAIWVLGSFIGFCVIHGIFFRYIKPFQGLSVLIKSYAVVGAIALVTMGVFVHYHAPPCMHSLWGVVSVVVIFGFVYTLLVLVYVLGVFSIVESSITMRLLMEISASQTKRCTIAYIEKKYSAEAIIRRRLERFVHMGELQYEKGRYHFQQKPVTFFRFREYIVQCIHLLFPRSN